MNGPLPAELKFRENPAHYYGQFALSLRKESLNGNVEKTGTSQRRKTNRFNNNKSLTVQDESDMNTPEEEHTRAIYNSNTMLQAPPTGITFSLNST